MRNPFRRRAVGLVAGYAADLAVGDPQRFHPVAGFGTVAGQLESLTYRDSRAAGLVHAAALITGAAVMSSRGTGTVAIALTVWSSIGGRSLCQTALRLAEYVDAGDIESARELVPWLCGRDPQSLDAAGLVRAALESVAENTSDATVAPLFWGAVGGSAGIAAYRASNTLDAMVGYRNARYERFGWASARIDDVLNYVPARLCGALIVVTAPVVGGSPRGAIRAWRWDAGKHPSPNAGVVESAMAGALGVGLGGTTVYAHGVEERPSLGDGPPPTVADLKRAVKLSSAVQAGAVISSAALAVAIGEFVRRRRGSRR